MNPVRSLAGRIALSLCALACLSGAAARAAEPAIAADFDGDGLHDRVTRDRVEPTVVRIWLSTTGTTSFVQFASPVAALAAVDLDGDRRAELVGADHRARLHVWTRALHGFRCVLPRTGAASGVTPARHGALDDGPSSELDTDTDVDTPDADAVLVAPVRGSPRPRAARATVVSSRLAPPLALLPRGPRPPPSLAL